MFVSELACEGRVTLEAGVWINARSITRLVIGGPESACPTTLGSKHAVITGTAKVIRSSGTTTESFAVEVDDCGEPGRGTRSVSKPRATRTGRPS